MTIFGSRYGGSGGPVGGARRRPAIAFGASKIAKCDREIAFLDLEIATVGAVRDAVQEDEGGVAVRERRALFGWLGAELHRLERELLEQLYPNRQSRGVGLVKRSAKTIDADT